MLLFILTSGHTSIITLDSDRYHSNRVARSLVKVTLRKARLNLGHLKPEKDVYHFFQQRSCLNSNERKRCISASTLSVWGIILAFGLLPAAAGFCYF